MEDPLGSYPLAIRQQGALFERNPVCALTYRVCMDMCEEYGGLHFNLMGSIEVADEVCLHLVRNAWQPAGIEQYYHWIQGRLDNNHAAVMCACATVSVSVSVMADAPGPLRDMGRNMRGLVYGEGNRILENLRSVVYQQDITLSADAYGEMPAMPLALRERMELEKENDKLVRQVIASKQKLKEMEAKQYLQYNAPVYQGCTFNDSHDTHYHYDANHASPSPPFTLPVPKEGKYSEVRRYIEERKRFDEEFKTFCLHHSLRDLCLRLSKEFGWLVDENSLQRNINRNR